MMKIIRRIFGGIIERQRSLDKLHLIFRPGRQVVHVKSGRVYDVMSAAADGAFLRDVKNRRLRLVVWLTPALTLRHEVAEKWDAYLMDASAGEENLSMQKVSEIQLQEEVLT